ncbi:elongation factor P maturation arginine rhamnosyltransferase EarP [Curvibacter sp. RS43]|uniref:elongation factor P maturation arginine rhamnosyltransferase EarP n=1 Tax=Curvibacter microcysteis TaxID=3026419 RepID=UPI0023622C41|nr:elongation factor P maturation arginine rhamnosyltransferase EarP [Curvibacter sp. RS43]MDD0809174.1 elongation factor P maturation arginine rhamnosyltransferase EarP [Curvibacter sp. RS43]
MLWDLFCTVIDNHGDLGVAWRLAAELGRRGEQVRLWVDDASALAWMAPQGAPGVSVHAWTRPLAAAALAGLPPADGLIEAFGCEIDAGLLAQRVAAPGPAPFWLNLEYLSAEAWVERCHALPSPVMSGPAAGLSKWFFYPGFTPRTGGLLREPGVADVPTDAERERQRRTLGAQTDECLVSLFCYEPAGLAPWLTQLHEQGLGGRPVRLHVMPGRPTAAVRACEAMRRPSDARDWLRLDYAEPVPQPAFDAKLRACDLNLVRGEDSLVRALWAGQPLVWHIYPQDDGAHEDKLEAFLDWLQAPPSLRRFHRVWNGLDSSPLPPVELATWRECVQAARQVLCRQDDLVTQLLRFCTEKR